MARDVAIHVFPTGSPFSVTKESEAQMSTTEPPSERSTPSSLTTGFEKALIYTILIAVLAMITCGTFWFALSSHSNYRDALDKARDLRGAEGLVVTLQLLRASDAFAIRIAGLFLSYLTVLLGSFFVVKGVEANYRLRIGEPNAKSALDTSSPGLVMVTAGTILFIFTMQTQSRISTTIPTFEDTKADQNVESAEVKKHAPETAP